MSEQAIAMFTNRLLKMKKHFGKWARKNHLDCYRIYDRDIPGFPFTIDIYDKHIYLSSYIGKKNYFQDNLKRDQLILQSLEKETLFEKKRERQKDKGQYNRLNKQGKFFRVREKQYWFLVNLSDYLDTGLFLDHRITRQMVSERARDQKVLNLFSYTGSFSVYAGGGGARQVVSIDLSNTYLDWAKRNIKINDLPLEKFSFIRADVLNFLKSERENSFDLIVLDPPTISRSKAMSQSLDIQRDHSQLIGDCLRLLRKGGVLFFSTNFQKFRFDVELSDTVSCKDITARTTDKDFQRRRLHTAYQLEKHS